MMNLVYQANQALQGEGGRMTAQRRAILETLQQLSGHPTADEIYNVARQKDPSLNLSTVYRTLRWLEKLDLVSAHIFNDERRQERFDPALPSDHYHFRCKRCNAIIEFSDPMLDEIKTRFENEYGGQVIEMTFVLYGYCEDCAAASTKESNGKLS